MTPWTAATRLLCPQNSLGKNTGVGCHFLLHLIARQVKILFSSALEHGSWGHCHSTMTAHKSMGLGRAGSYVVCLLPLSLHRSEIALGYRPCSCPGRIHCLRGIMPQGFHLSQELLHLWHPNLLLFRDPKGQKHLLVK